MRMRNDPSGGSDQAKSVVNMLNVLYANEGDKTQDYKNII